MARARFPMFIPQRLAVHHSASRRSTRFADVERWHTDPKSAGGNGWPAPGYNVGINAAGNSKIWRIVPQRGAAVARNNSGTINVLLMGHNLLEIPAGKPLHRTPHENRRWAQVQVDALVAYVDACLTIWPHLDASIGGHRDFTVPGRPSVCPGLDIATLRRYGWKLDRYWRHET